MSYHDQEQNQPEVTTTTENVPETNHSSAIPVEGEIPDPIFLTTPSYFVCPNCNFEGSTSVDRIRGCISFMGLCCGALCGDYIHDYRHICPQCKTIIAIYEAV